MGNLVAKALMPISEIGMSTRTAQPYDNHHTAQRGFTLIELMIVLVIIGIVSTATLYAFGDFGTSRKAKVAAEQFVSYLKLLEQRAILETSTLGIKINPAGYETYRLENGAQWKRMPRTDFFHEQRFPTKITVLLQSSIQHQIKTPDIMINPSGDMTTFQLYFGTQRTPHLIQLIGQHNGDITLQHTPNT